MAVSKVRINGVTRIDATTATAVAEDITAPKTAMLANGEMTEGTGSGGDGGWTTDGLLDGSEPTGDLVTTIANIADAALTKRTNVTSLTAPNATHVGSNAFESCTGLKKIVIGGNNATFGSYVVRYCSALKEIHVPNAASGFGFGGYGLQGCTALELIDYGATNTLAFNYLPACPLHTIIIRKSNGLATLSANALNNSTAFQSGGTGGTVYIPETYYNHLGDGTSQDYKNATNWSVYDGYGTITWKKIEGSVYEL